MIIGQQILYKPNHMALPTSTFNGVPDGCEFGFVTNIVGDFAFCRFWKRFQYPLHDPRACAQLRTVANSERCSIHNLLPWEVVPQEWVEALLATEGWNAIFAFAEPHNPTKEDDGLEIGNLRTPEQTESRQGSGTTVKSPQPVTPAYLDDEAQYLEECERRLERGMA
jgi:hypothetical protein